MRLSLKINIIASFLSILLGVFVLINAIKTTIEYKKDVRNFKEEILMNHNFNKSEIHFLLDY